jgi:hypothetical protein
MSKLTFAGTASKAEEVLTGVAGLPVSDCAEGAGCACVQMAPVQSAKINVPVTRGKGLTSGRIAPF